MEAPIITGIRKTGGSRSSLFLLIAVLLLAAGPVSAYVGPGAGFGIVTSFLVFLNAIAVSVLSALLWPVNFTRRLLRRSRRESPPLAKRVVVLGLDGLSPEVAGKLMESGGMPNLGRLASEGTFARLGTTCPGISPVAWSSFQTGVNPGRHGIFDFLAPDRKRYIPVLSSVRTGVAAPGTVSALFGRKKPRPFIRLLRKSRPFWTILRRYGMRSTVLRVPITYPPEPLDGHLLSGMCVPDLRGTQGSYTLFSESPPEEPVTGGLWRRLREVEEYLWEAEMPGPINGEGDADTLRILLRSSSGRYIAEVDGTRLELTPGVLSDWAQMVFRPEGKKVRGIARFCLTHDDEGSPVLYSTAVHVDPFSPSVPISHPVHYSRYLAGLYGPFATLGLAEDTWALSNGAISGKTFLDQAWSIFDERKRMFFDALDRNRSGLVACVFDTSDRIQHMFWSEGHEDGTPVHEMYTRMDRLIGETVNRLGRKDMLVVMSDHGFTSFHTCIDLNRWLLENGYLALEEGVEKVDTSFKGVDWSASRAWSMGLSGIMLNLRGRESGGIVEPGGEADELIDEISRKLMLLEDENGAAVISAVYRGDDVYNGPYAGDGPDLIVGTGEGFRAGWGCVTGGVGERVLYANDRHWNGDHCHDHRLVPGVLASNFSLDAEGASIIDVAPTALRALGVRPPSYMEGRPLFPKEDPE